MISYYFIIAPLAFGEVEGKFSVYIGNIFALNAYQMVVRLRIGIEPHLAGIDG